MLWRQPVTPDGTRGSWEYLLSECHAPGDVGIAREALTWEDVLSAVRRIGVPSGTVEAPEFTLVNLETSFYTEPHQVERTLEILGYTVDVVVAPSTYTWHWGDGSTTETTTPGRPYPATDVTHTYDHHTRAARPRQLRLDVTYTARYRVDGGGWSQIPETITVTGPTRELPVRQASPVLTDH